MEKTIIECPRCHKQWAEISWEFGKPVTFNDIRVLDGSKVFKEDDILACTMCNYEYRECDVVLAIASKVKIDDKI